MPITEFLSQMGNHGFDPGHIEADGKIHRFSTNGKRGDKSGWCVLYANPFAGAYGDWRTGETFTWSSVSQELMTPPERYAFREKMRQAHERRQQAQAEAQAKAAQKALSLWKKAKPASPEHPYLKQKGLRPTEGIQQLDDALVVPMKSFDGELHSLQFIQPGGKKRFLADGKIAGCASWIKGDSEKALMLCEGYATAMSIHEATGATVIIASNLANLEPVAKQVRERNPQKAVVMCGDNDAFTTSRDGKPWNPGYEKAISVGWKHGTTIAIPQFKDSTTEPTDFNDLYQLEGLGVVRAQIEDAKLPQEILLEESQGNKGAAFKPEHLAGLNRLKENDTPAFRDLRHKLKRLQVGVVALDKAMNADQGSNDDKIDGGHLSITRRVIEGIGAENILNTGIFVWQWDKCGVWRKSDDEEIRQKIHSVMPIADVTKNQVESILSLFKTEVFKPRHEFDVNTTAINCLSGELHWTGEKWELREHERENFRTTQIPVKYDPKATAPRFESFLSEIFEGDSDAEQKAILICELIGYTLLTSTAFEIFVLLIGPGANGKSVLLQTVADLAGRENVAAVQPSQFDSRFQRAHLYNKLMNLVTEIPEGHVIKDAELKSIVSGELSTVEYKHKPPFDFRPYATCWFGSNHMPHTRDFSEALFRRAQIIPFNRTFQEHEQDKRLKDKLEKELPGILKLGLEAMANVFQRGGFTKTESCEKAKREWRLNCDQVQQFAEERCVFEPGVQTPSNNLFDDYRKWAEEAGIGKIVNRKNFTTRVCLLGAERARGTGGVRCLAGIRLQDQGDQW